MAVFLGGLARRAYHRRSPLAPVGPRACSRNDDPFAYQAEVVLKVGAMDCELIHARSLSD
jgi:hypothetical protein